jgi:DNA-binding GntR family transcriptional regulator
MAGADVAQTNVARVQEQLREAILSGRLEPGTRLRSEALGERLRASRTPVREALLLLAREGLVDVHPRRGATVRAFDGADVAEAYDVRALLEPHAASLAAQRRTPDELRRLAELYERSLAYDRSDEECVAEQMRINDEFHRLILDAARSDRLAAAITSATGLPRAFRTSFWSDDRQRTQSLGCHRDLVAAIGRGNAQFAETVMRMHIQGAAAFLSDVIADA